MTGVRKFVAEFIGTFALVLFGVGAILQQHQTQMVGITGIAVAHGLAILVSIYALGHISGGHFNPAVSFSFFVTRRMNAGTMLLYWAAQFLGAIVAACILKQAYFVSGADVNYGAPVLDPSVRPFLAALLEGIAAFMLVTVIFGTAVDPRAPAGFAGLAIGLTITANVLMGGILTHMCFNPARALGPALIGGQWQDHWVYWVGPLLGGGAAALLYDKLLLKRA
jgi:aquaporin TIP